MLKNVLRVGAAGRELRSFFSQLAQEPLSALVDKRDFIEVHDASAAHMRAMVLPPTCPEFMHPGIGKPAMQNPSFFGRCFTETDFQHAISLRTCQ